MGAGYFATTSSLWLWASEEQCPLHGSKKAVQGAGGLGGGDEHPSPLEGAPYWCYLGHRWFSLPLAWLQREGQVGTSKEKAPEKSAIVSLRGGWGGKEVPPQQPDGGRATASPCPHWHRFCATEEPAPACFDWTRV